jgi:hypothetical protein
MDTIADHLIDCPADDPGQLLDRSRTLYIANERILKTPRP